MINVIFFDLDETLAAQEDAFSGAYRAAAGLAAKVAGVDPDSFERAIPRTAASRFERLRIAAFVRRCRFGGRDVLWGDPSGASDPLRELTSLTPVYRHGVWKALLAKYDVGDPELCELLDARFREEMAERLIAFSEVEVALANLSSHYRLAIITNGMPAAQAEKLRRLGLAQYFEVLVASAEVGIGKPAGGIFRHALASMGVSASESVMVGDSLEGDITGALGAGMAACWLRRNISKPGNIGLSIPVIPDLSGLESLLESPSRTEPSRFPMKAAPATR